MVNMRSAAASARRLCGYRCLSAEGRSARGSGYLYGERIMMLERVRVAQPPTAQPINRPATAQTRYRGHSVSEIQIRAVIIVCACAESADCFAHSSCGGLYKTRL